MPREFLMSIIIYLCCSSRTVRRSYPLVHLCLLLGLAAIGCAAESAPPPPSPQMTYWPVELPAAEGRIEIYQPQPEAISGDMLTARSAVSLTRPGAAAPVFGTAWFTTHIVTDRDARTVTIRDATVKDVRFPGATAVEEQDFAREISTRLSTAEVTFPLDQLTASLDTAHREEIEAAQMQTTPPRIILSTTPATLISINGQPQMLRVDGQDGVFRVVDTPFIILFDDAGGLYYIKAGVRWVSAPSLAGPWADTSSVPPTNAAAGTSLLAPTTQPSATRTASTAAEIAPAASDAKVIVATDPTELIVTTGNPQFTPLPGAAGAQLLYASNTASNLFLDQADHHYYVLLSGRWYAAASLQGPWQHVASNQLPAAIAKIPAHSPKADVLAFVPGTPEAHAAVLDASIPQTSAIRRDAGADLSVAYDGTPH